MTQIEVGQRFTRLVVIEEGFRRSGHPALRCECDCGKTVVVRAASLRSQNTKSCGCFRHETLVAAGLANGLKKVHGQSNCVNGRSSIEYTSWQAMRARCNNPNATGFKYYGGRGITICDRWGHFESFFADMGVRPTPVHSLDRINPDGNYEPLNCRWATPKEQIHNRRARKKAN